MRLLITFLDGGGARYFLKTRDLAMATFTKRPRGSPTGSTPRQKEKHSARFPAASKKELSFEETSTTWSKLEESTLVDYVIQKGYMTTWPTTKHLEFWEGASQFLGKHCVGSKRTSEYNS